MFNVEPYVERCIRSLEDQDIPKNDYEIICINDGSPDNSRDVVITLQNEFDNIILIDQENKGVSVSRNRGIDIAQGKYILMVDPDDFIKPKSLIDKLRVLDNNNLDVGITGFIILNEQSDPVFCHDPHYDVSRVMRRVTYSLEYERGRSDIRDPHRSWAIFFRTEFLRINDLLYLSEVPYLEDGEFMARITCLAQRVVFINDPFYLRTTRPGSATHSMLFYSNKAKSGFLKAANNLIKFKNDNCVTQEQVSFINQPIIHFITLYLISHGFMG